MELFTPEWPYWQKKQHAALWECVALSCGIDPQTITPRTLDALRGADMTAIDFSSALQAQLFPKIQSRLDAAIEALDDGDFKVIELQVTRWNPEVDQARLAPVALAEFFGWAIGQPWELPDEAASLSGPPKGKVSPAAENNLTLVGALLELLLPTYHGKQDALIADLPDKFPGVKGLGESNLKHKFADAKKSLGNAQQTAQLKVKKK